MRIGLHNEPSGGSIGGSESCVAVLAEGLAADGEVEIIHHRTGLKKSTLEALAGVDLSRVQMRYVEPANKLLNTTRNPWQLHRKFCDWSDRLSQGYDVFITLTHGVPSTCLAKFGIVYVLFPIFRLSGPLKLKQPWTLPSEIMSRLKASYWNWNWNHRIESYDQVTAISEYSRAWCKRRWKIDTGVIHPPVDTDFPPISKGNIILSVGRFTTRGHSKCQVEMMRAFRDLVDAGLSGWEYYCVGGLGDNDQDQDYFESVRSLAPSELGHVLANVDRNRLRELYSEAKIFWHAAGFGTDEATHPELAEHFGMSTVESMAAGCVPVVIARGAQPELVTNGTNGFLWSTLNELAERTLTLTKDETLRSQMSVQAVITGQRFDKQRFVEAFRNLLPLGTRI